MATKIASTFVFSRSKMTCSNPLYSILDTNYSILNTNYPTPSTQYSLLNTHSSLLSTYYSNLTFSSTSTTAPRYLAQCKWPVCMYLRHGPPQGKTAPNPDFSVSRSEAEFRVTEQRGQNNNNNYYNIIFTRSYNFLETINRDN